MATAPLSKSQYGVYAECIGHEGEIFYNLPYVHTLDPAVDTGRMAQAIVAAVKAHPTLLSRIAQGDDGEPMQTLDAEGEDFAPVVRDIVDIEAEKPNLVKPFDLLGGRLLRIELLRAPGALYLFIDIHHIIADGTTLNLLLEDIDRAYGGAKLEPEALSMAQYARDEATRSQTPAFDEGRRWYAEHFDCGDTYTPLMPDLEVEQHSEAKLLRDLKVDSERVEQFCKEHGVFKSTLFTAAYSLLLSRFNNESEALFNTVFNGRSDKRFARSAGMVVKTLPVYAKFDAGTTVMDFLMAHQQQMAGCRKHDIYSYADMAKDLNLQSNTIFVWHGTIFGKDTMAGKPMLTQRIGNSTIGASCYLKTFARGGSYHVMAEYNSNEYSEALIAQYLESYEAALTGLLAAERLAEIDITTSNQREGLDAFNRTDVDYDDTQTIVSLFARQAAATPRAEAVVYKKDVRLTYAEVDRLSNRIAAYVSKLGLGAEDVVSVLIPRCQWMAVASLGVLKAGCAYQPLDPSYPAERLNFMMQDANAGLLIADAELLSIVPEYKGPVLLTSDIDSLPDAPAPQVAVKPEQLFILLYTSGSTGVPKGVQLTHGNLVAFCDWYWRHYDLKPEHRVAAYASYGFDACMMDMYPALTIGASVHIVPEEIRLDLVALSDYFEQQGITHSFMTTQVGYQFATSVDCHSLLHLSVGGEKLAALTPPKGYRFHNAYGPTECTIFTTTFEVPCRMREIPIGKQLDNLRLYVVDAHGRRQPVGAAGELWVSGPQVGRGYLNRPEKTAEVFVGNPFSDEAKYSRIYRTGDIVRFLPSGDVQFVGRRDGQVKIRGFRIELKEVEAVIREYPGIKDATVQAFDEEGGGKFIAAYVVADEPVDIEALNNFILDRKPPYMVPAATMQLDAIPLNQNQKVNKRALPRPEKKVIGEQAESSAPLNVLEQQLHDMVSKIVGNTDFGITTVLGYVGLTSISAIKLAVQVNKRFGVALDTKSLVKSGTIQGIENEILQHMFDQASQGGAPAPKAEAAQARTEAPLTYAQTGVYFDCLKNPASTIYNIPYMLTWPQGVTAEALTDAVRRLWALHPALHIHFETRGSDIVQTTDGATEPVIPVSEMSDQELQDYKNKFVKPFNLQRPPLCRFEVVVTPSATHLLLDVHHLLFDGGSADVFISQITDLLEGREVTAEQLCYLDFAIDQQQAEQGEAFAEAGRFFAGQLAACEGASEIPADLKGSDTVGEIGEAVVPVDHNGAAEFCRNRGITPAHLFYAATAYVVSRYTASRDVYLCTVSNGRSNLATAGTVGMFVGTLPLHLSIDDVTVAELLSSASSSFDDTLRNEGYPLARIAADYNFRPAIAYAYQVGVLAEYKVGGKPVGLQLLELNVPKFKINVKIEDRGVVVQYDDLAYSHDLGRNLAESIATVAAAMMAQPDIRARQLSIVSRRQAAELDTLRSAPVADAPLHLMHDCIAHYAAVQPDHQALVAADAEFTYAEMDRATLCMAHGLRQRGVQPRDRVALLLPRTSRLILSLFAVLRAGAAYIPCDPEYPADRVKLILEDSEARFIITTADRLATLPEGKGIDVEQLLACDDCSPLDTGITPDDLAYLIYTSGSTGRPKGVMLRHEGICNYLYGHPANVLAHAVATDATRVLSVTTISFDAALQDIGIGLYNGKTLVVATEEQTGNPLDLARLITEQHIDMVSGTPSRWLTWLTSPDFCRAIAGIHIARAGGEKFSDQLLQQLRQATKARIFNCYGPTETTVACNNKELTTATGPVTVGRPQLGVTEFVVDADGNELPVGVVGELYIGGRGVGRGYNNLDQMTRERFIDYHGERVYRSGDYARWLPDGDVVILGRTDNQIKLRGLRIELGEIENVMLRVDGMKKVVIVIRQIAGKEHLCAYYTAAREIAPDALKAEIAKSLTQYMVPTAYLQLDRMPMTPNGKTDVKALPEPQLAAAAAYVEPATDVERTFCQIFADILQMERVGATDNFFDLGGTSLVVTRVIIEADKAGHHVAYGDVFANPTPRSLAKLVTGEAPDNADAADDVATFDYSAIDALLGAGNTLQAFRGGERQQLGRVLVTGATGFLGIHILHELIASDAQRIYCLVRGRSVEEAESRLKTLLFYYFDDACDSLFGNRLHIVLGDVTRDFDPQLQVDTIFNCAAVVKHFAEGTEIEDVNVGGAQRCVDYCLNHGARLVHISTASTRGLWAGEPRGDVFTEQRFYMGQFLGNKYIHSKFMAERVILDAVARRGLNAKIMRVGNLAARSTDGEFQANFATNSFMGRIKVYNMLGVCPYAMRSKRVEFSPINEVSHAIVLLASTPRKCCVFHPYNNHTQLLGDVLEGLRTVGQGVRFVEQEEFQQAMEQAKNDPVKSKSMASLLAYQDMAHGQRTTDVTRDNDYTTQVLYRLGFVWSPTSWDYVERMLVAIGGLGFFD